MEKYSLPVFWLLTVNFLFLIIQIFMPSFALLRGSNLFLIPFVTIFIFGGVLAFFSCKGREKNKLKKIFFLTGLSSCGIFISFLLHNFLWGIAEFSKDMIVLKYAATGLHVVFFFASVVFFPIALLIGIGAGIIFIIKKNG